MKKLLAASCLVLVIALVGATQTTAQTEPLDLGEQDPFIQACSTVKTVLEANGNKVRNCRRAAPDVINGNDAKVIITVATEYEKFKLEFYQRKSLWQTSTVIQTG